MDNAYLGCVMPWALTYAPSGWAMCNGQTLQITQNAALYAILGSTYGGDGKTTFMLPNLNGRIPLTYGSPGPAALPGTIATTTLGAVGGNSQITLNANNLPPHNHGVTPGSFSGTAALPIASSDTSNVGTVKVAGANNLFAKTSANIYTNTGTADTQIPGLSVTTTPSFGATGGSGQIQVLPPYLALSYIICISGIFPPRP